MRSTTAVRSFGSCWMRADSFLNWDTKFLHSINLLLLRPWKLTNDFNAGRRARYVHPLRLYLIASIVFFLLARAINLQTPASVELTPQDRAELVASLGKLTGPDSPLSPEQREKVEAARTKIVGRPRSSHRPGTRRAQEGFSAIFSSPMCERTFDRKSGRRCPGCHRPHPRAGPDIPEPPTILQSIPQPASAAASGPIHRHSSQAKERRTQFHFTMGRKTAKNAFRSVDGTANQGQDWRGRQQGEAFPGHAEEQHPGDDALLHSAVCLRPEDSLHPQTALLRRASGLRAPHPHLSLCGGNHHCARRHGRQPNGAGA